MSCTTDPPSCSLRELGTRPAQVRGWGLATLAFAALLSGACSSPTEPGDGPTQTGGSSGSTQPPGGGGWSGSSQPPAGGGASGSSQQPGGGSSSGAGQPGAGSGSGGSTPVPVGDGGTMLRLLTQTEYLNSVQALLGTLTTQLALPPDNSVAGFISVGASQANVTDSAATDYETASRAATAEVFADTQRWQKLVGCAPKNDLSDACVTTYIKNFGRRTFRRDLAEDEVQQWLGVAKNAAMLAGSAAQGLAAATSGLLQSPFFLYRVEVNKIDSSNGRLKYDGLSMAHRISFALTGGPPSAELLNAATSGQLDTAEGVRTAAAPLLATPSVVDRMTAFFSEYVLASRVLNASKSATLFPSFNDALKNSMYQGTQLFLKNIVLAPNADVRSFFDSNQTFADTNLATIYGIQAPASGFAQVTLPASTGRAGIIGQAGIIAGHSQPDRTSPTRRGIFILEHLLCTFPPPPIPGIPEIQTDPTLTTREQLALHRESEECAGCHRLMDPPGLAMEHFDPIGRYREMENGKPIDATGDINGVPFDGVAELGAVLRQDPRAMACLLSNFYRNANGRADDGHDYAQISSLAEALASRGYVWSSFLADFVASDAFRSAPALPVTTGSM